MEEEEESSRSRRSGFDFEGAGGLRGRFSLPLFEGPDKDESKDEEYKTNEKNELKKERKGRKRTQLSKSSLASSTSSSLPSFSFDSLPPSLLPFFFLGSLSVFSGCLLPPRTLMLVGTSSLL